MTITGGGSGGGGSGLPRTSDICSVSPSDRVAGVDNLVRRVEAIEAVLSRLLGGDVWANQLSDISGSGGVITDMIAVASNAAGGWVTDGTFTGVAISTLGWTMSDGNAFPVVTMENGVLQFGFGAGGSVGGAIPDRWDACCENGCSNCQPEGPYCIELTKASQTVTGCTAVQTTHYPVFFDTFNNNQMYSVPTARINFLNTTPREYRIELSATWRNNSDNPEASVLYPIAYYGDDDTEIFPSPIDIILCQSTQGDPFTQSASIVVTDADFVYPNYMILGMNDGLCPSSIDVNWSNIRFSVCTT